MVALIRDFGNKFCSFSAFHTPESNMTHSSDINMTSEIVNVILKSACDNYDKVRGHTMTSNTHSPRTASLFSSKCDEDYTTKVQQESDNMVENDPVVMSDNPQLEYATPSSQPHRVSKASDLPSNARPQHVDNTQPTLNNCGTDNGNVFNVQL